MKNRVTDENNQILSNAVYAIDKNKILIKIMIVNNNVKNQPRK